MKQKKGLNEWHQNMPTDKPREYQTNVQSVTFLMIKDNIVRGSRMMREAINDLNSKKHETKTE